MGAVRREGDVAREGDSRVGVGNGRHNCHDFTSCFHTSRAHLTFTPRFAHPAYLNTSLFIPNSSYPTLHTQLFIRNSSYATLHTQLFIPNSSYPTLHKPLFIPNSSYATLHTQLFIPKPSYPTLHTCQISGTKTSESM